MLFFSALKISNLFWARNEPSISRKGGEFLDPLGDSTSEFCSMEFCIRQKYPYFGVTNRFFESSKQRIA
jgi:hypothetical protein